MRSNKGQGGSRDGMDQHDHPGHPAWRHLRAVRDRAVAVVRHHAACQHRARRSDRALGLCGFGCRPGHRTRSVLLPDHRRAGDVPGRLRLAARPAQSNAERRPAAAAAGQLRHFDHHPERVAAGVRRLHASPAGRRDRDRKPAIPGRHHDRRLPARGVRRGAARARAACSFCFIKPASAARFAPCQTTPTPPS